MPVKTILVTGATDKQGRALIQALAPSSSSPPFTRPNSNPRRPRHIPHPRSDTHPNLFYPLFPSTYLEEYLTLVQGDLDDEASVGSVLTDAKTGGGGTDIFRVLPFPGWGKNGDGRRNRGKAVANSASSITYSLPPNERREGR